MAKISDKWKVGPDGKRVKVYIIRYQDKGKLSASGKPVHRQESFPKKKLAEARLLQIQNELANGTHVARSADITVAELCELFLKNAEDRRRDGRIGRYYETSLKSHIVNGILPYLGGVKLGDLDMLNIERCYLDNVRKGVSPMTAKRRIITLRVITDFAKKRKMFHGDAVEDALKELRGISQPAVRTPDPDEVRRLLKAAEHRPFNRARRTQLRLQIFVNAAAFCGLRFGEIAALTMENVDLAERVIRVRHNITRWDEMKAPKTRAGIRDVPMPPHLAAMFRTWIDEHYRPNDRRILLTGGRDGASGNLMNFHHDTWQPLLKYAGLVESEGLHFHALRHFAASWWIQNGMPLPDVARLMGHSKVDMTLSVYTHSLSNRATRSDLVDRMSGALMALPVVLDEAPAQEVPG